MRPARSVRGGGSRDPPPHPEYSRNQGDGNIQGCVLATHHPMAASHKKWRAPSRPDAGDLIGVDAGHKRRRVNSFQNPTPTLAEPPPRRAKRTTPSAERDSRAYVGRKGVPRDSNRQIERAGKSVSYGNHKGSRTHLRSKKLFIINRLWRGGEKGIRTLETLLEPTPLAGERLRPLGHLSAAGNIPLFTGLSTAHRRSRKINSRKTKQEHA